MAFSTQQPKVVFGVLVAVLHLDLVARQLGHSRPGKVPFILLARVAPIGQPTRRLPLLRQASHVCVHQVSF
jgi:hypothetical protein